MRSIHTLRRPWLAACFLAAALPAGAQTVFINEIHYDNTGADAGEGVEIAGPAGTNLAGWIVQPYNGSGGVTYTPIGTLSGTIPDLGGGFGTLFFSIVGLQNGAPDGLALVNNVPAVVQFLSYEGAFTATNGPANTMLSADIGVTEPGNVLSQSLQLTGTGTVYTDFTWAVQAANTYNAFNNGQTFAGGGSDPVVGFVNVAASTVEGGAGSIGVRMDIAPAANVTVTISDDLSGTADALDYTTFSDVVLTYTPTDTYPFTQNVSLFTTPDVDYESDETVVLNMNITTGTADPGNATHTHTIQNDDLPQIVINEVDYDQTGTDALEFIELKNNGATSVPLLGLKVELINGSGNVLYQTFTLPNVNLAANDYFVICGTGSSVPNCDFQNGVATNLIQNGAPDGIRLATTSNILIDQMSYEGSMSTTEGTAPADIDDGTEPQQGLSRLPDGQDSNNNSADFSMHCTSPGLSNLSSTQFCLCEPATFTYFPSCIDAFTWNIIVVVSSTGSGSTVDITNSLNGSSQLGVGTGVHVIGPFNNFDVVNITVAHEVFSECDEVRTGITKDCTPPPPCFDNECELTILTDNFPAEITWTIEPAGGGAPVCSGGPYFIDLNTEIEVCCLPDGCYDLIFNDGFGDGITDPTGAITLRDQFGNRILDGDATYTSVSQATLPFCLPLGADRLTIATCDREDLSPTSVIVASPNAAVTAEYTANTNNNLTDDGYQFWILDPDGGYSRMIYKSHANPGSPGGPVGGTACAHLKLSSIITLPVPTDRLLNVRVRSRLNGVNAEFGPACRMKVLSTPIACPTTQLDNNPLHIGTTYSCGVTGKVVAASGNAGKIWATPLVGANRYRFEFAFPAESYTRTITLTTYVLQLNAWITSPLICGTNEYDVRVQASFDGGATFCAYGSACTVEITNNPPHPCTTTFGNGGVGLNSTVNTGAFSLFPNPAQDGHVTLQLSGLSTEVEELSIDMFDLFGRKVMAHTIATDGAEEISTVLALPGTMATGVYLVNVTAGTLTYSERLMVE
ncbi:MAG: lamin tail domain-containing protein [Flavobacteriales bacterium]